MPFSKYGRIGFALAAALTICSATAAATTLTLDDYGARTNDTIVMNFVIVSSLPDYLPAFDIKVVDVADVPRSIPFLHPFAKRVSHSGAAVRPTSVAGWRSGRVRHLARC